MSSVDESLEKQFKEIVRRRTDGQSNESLGIDDFIEWFKSLPVFETLKHFRSDIEEFFKKTSISEKYGGSSQTASTSGITSKDFIKILEDIAARLKIKAEEFKKTVLEETREKYSYEKMLIETLERGQKSLESITEWLYTSLEQFEISKSEVTKAIKNAQVNSRTFTYDDLVHAVKEISAKYNINADILLSDIIKSKMDPGVLPHPDDNK